MTDRVAVYIDFDNVVISRYDNIHGDGAWRKDEARHHRPDATSSDTVDVKLAQAEVDLGAIVDYAASFGVVAMTRAYADWSVPANSAYRKALVDRAVDLVQLFAAAGTKNGADIRLAVDTVEDLSRHPDITHVTLVAGDSDFVPLAQRCKRMGRFVVGIGVAGSTSRALVNACDEFQSYEALPGVTPPPPKVEPHQVRARQEGRGQEDDGQEGRGQEGGGGPRADRTARAVRGHRPAAARRAGRAPEERRRVDAQLEREEPDAADEPWLQGEGSGLLVVPRVHRVARRDPRDQGSSTTASCSCG